jgi:LmbE family N-acetylglucosaminyl deacetylase
MVVFAHTVLCVALLAAAGSSLLNARWLRRHTRHPEWIRLSTVLAAILLVPCAVMCAMWSDVHFPFWVSLAVQVAGWTTLVMLLVVVRGTPMSEQLGVVSRPRRILAVGAHPDDLELGCGATLACWIDAGFEVHGLVMSNGERGGNAALRPTEARSAAHFLGAHSVTVLDFPDTRLAQSSADLVVAIEKAIREIGPDMILTHSANDSHQDHQAVHFATLRAARFHTSVLCYESPSATMEFQPTVFVDVAGYVEIKILAISRHRDQIAKPYMSVERIRATAAYRGGQAKVRHAEGYEPVRLLASRMELIK